MAQRPDLEMIRRYVKLSKAWGFADEEYVKWAMTLPFFYMADKKIADQPYFKSDFSDLDQLRTEHVYDDYVMAHTYDSDFYKKSDYVKGVDFRITKTTKGGYADYSTSKWSRRERALDEAERAAIDTHGLFNLGDFRPKEPTEAEVKIIKELFEKSVEGEAYDLEQYGQYFRPAGVAYQGKPQVAVPTSSAPMTEAAPKQEPATESAPTPQPEATPIAPAGDSAKRAEDILKLIRSRQAK